MSLHLIFSQLLILGLPLLALKPQVSPSYLKAHPCTQTLVPWFRATVTTHRVQPAFKLRDLHFKVMKVVGSSTTPSWPSTTLFTRGSKGVALLLLILFIRFEWNRIRGSVEVSSLYSRGFDQVAFSNSHFGASLLHNSPSRPPISLPRSYFHSFCEKK